MIRCNPAYRDISTEYRGIDKMHNDLCSKPIVICYHYEKISCTFSYRNVPNAENCIWNNACRCCTRRDRCLREIGWYHVEEICSYHIIQEEERLSFAVTVTSVQLHLHVNWRGTAVIVIQNISAFRLGWLRLSTLCAHWQN